MAELTYAEISKLLKHDPDKGKLFWRTRTPDMFIGGKKSDSSSCAAWNGRFAGKETFYTVNSNGYLKGMIFGRGYFAHRVLWLLHTGEWPADQIDHINGDRADNRLANLRPVSFSENMRNRRKQSNNSTGVVGVCWSKQSNRWLAQIVKEGRQSFLGNFTDIAAAAKARKAAEVELGFHDNHGRSLDI